MVQRQTAGWRQEIIGTGPKLELSSRLDQTITISERIFNLKVSKSPVSSRLKGIILRFKLGVKMEFETFMACRYGGLTVAVRLPAHQ